MDAGIATEDNVAWLRDNGYRYLVVSRQRTRRFDPERSIAIKTRSHHKVHLHKEVDEDRGEVRLYCYSEERAKKEEGIARRFAERFESELRKLHEGLSRPRTRKGLDSVWQRIGRIQERCRGAGQHYTVDVVADPHSAKAVAVTWKYKPLAGTMLTHPGVYCLRSNVHDWDPQTLWRTYTMLTDLEAVFRSLKSELGLRPIFHKTQNRSDGSSPTNWSRPSADASPNTERTPVGPLCVVSSKASTVSPHPSAERTAVPSTSARPPVPSNHNSKSTPLSISTPHPVGSPN